MIQKYRKRKILATIVLSLSFMFGRSRLGSSQSPRSDFENQPIQERMITDRYANLFEENDRQVMVAKTDGNLVTPPTNRGPSNFPTPPTGITSKNSMLNLRGGGIDPKELAVQMMVLHHLMKQGISFQPPIRQVPQVGQVRRHPMGRPRMRRQEFPIEPRLEGPANVGIGDQPLPASRLLAKPNGQGYNIYFTN